MIQQVTPELLRKIAVFATKLRTELYAPYLETYTTLYDIRTKLRFAHFIAQIIHESGSFRYVREIATGKAYEGRLDLGNTEPGDGVRFKGRGLIQITGKTNYTQVSEALGVDFVSNPELLEEPRYAVQSACWWWHNRNLNTYADRDDIRKITRIINGGYNGLDDRIFWYDRATFVLNSKD